MVSSALLSDLQIYLKEADLGHSQTRMVLVDGFLLYHDLAIRERLDVRLFLRLSHDTAKKRRFTRQGYGAKA